jgi:hypothetical protein
MRSRIGFKLAVSGEQAEQAGLAGLAREARVWGKGELELEGTAYMCLGTKATVTAMEDAGSGTLAALDAAAFVVPLWWITNVAAWRTEAILGVQLAP